MDMRGDFRVWHKADVTPTVGNVCFSYKSGPRPRRLSSSARLRGLQTSVRRSWAYRRPGQRACGPLQMVSTSRRSRRRAATANGRRRRSRGCWSASLDPFQLSLCGGWLRAASRLNGLLPRSASQSSASQLASGTSRFTGRSRSCFRISVRRAWQYSR
jgi:hypothetical protein